MPTISGVVRARLFPHGLGFVILMAVCGCGPSAKAPGTPTKPATGKPAVVGSGGGSAAGRGKPRGVVGPGAGSAAPNSPLRFAEVAEAAGVDFQHVSGMTVERYLPTANGSGLAILDYDGDGKLDLYFVSGCFLTGDRPEGRNRLYRNLGDWKFEDVTEKSGAGFHGYCHGVVAADFDNDGDTDLFLATYHANTYLLNNGDGTFRDVGEAAGVAPPGFKGRLVGGGVGIGPIYVDAMPGLMWRVDGGEPSMDLAVKVRKGQRVVFRQADPTMTRGLELLAANDSYRLAGEDPALKPAAALIEVGVQEGEPTRLYRGQKPLDEGAEPVVMAEIEIVRELDMNPVGFECSEHRTAWSSGGAPIDYDSDGDLDLYVSNYGFWTADEHGLKFCGDTTRGVRQYCSPQEITTVRHTLYRNDGLVDGVTRFVDATDEAGLNRSDGHGFGVIAADLDGDRRIDLHVANDQNPAFLYLNNGDGTFQDLTDLSGAAYDSAGNTQSGMGADSADIDGDGRPELFRTNFQGEYNTLFTNLGNGVFYDKTAAVGLAADSIPWVGWGCALADFDSDGWPDIFVANGHVDNNYDLIGEPNVPYEEPPLLFLNVPNDPRPGASREFRRVVGAGPYFESSHVGRGAALGDLDDDGDLDLVINQKDGHPALLRNETPMGDNHWLRLDLRGGHGSPLHPIGTNVQIVVDGRTIVRQLKGGCSLESTNDPRLTIGLGPASSIETVLITWPSGKEMVLRSVALDQEMRVEEPEEASRDLHQLDSND